MKTILKRIKFLSKSLHNPVKFPEPVKLQKEAERIKHEYIYLEKSLSSSYDLDKLISKIYFLWKTEGKSGFQKITLKEKRAIPYILFNKTILNDVDLLESLLKFLEPIKSYTLATIIVEYLSKFQNNKQFDILRSFILEHIVNSNNPTLKKWKTKINFLFTEKATTNTAKLILFQKNKNLTRCLKEDIGIEEHLFGSNFIKEVILQALEITKVNIQYVPIVLELTHLANYPSELLPVIASSLIPPVEQYNKKEIKEKLTQFLIEKLEDPRLPKGRVNWSEVNKEAYEIFIKWLSQKDIEFFFKVIGQASNDPNWKYRQKFWEAYLPFIEKTWVILGRDARYLAENKGYKFGILSGGRSDQSAFLVKIGEYIFLEWSHEGACRVYKKEDFPYEFGEEYYKTSVLRNIYYVFKVNHIYSDRYKWQNKLSSWLHWNLKIVPSKSYYIDDERNNY